MSNALLMPETTAVHPEVMCFLRGRDNPFDVFVAARRPEANFLRYHVPAVYREVYNALRAVVDRYRPGRIERESDVPKAGVLVLLGNRGTGKTHMVHALEQSVGAELPCVVIAPSIYEPHRPFIEYLLHQVVRHFQNEMAGNTPGTLHRLADALARQVLIQAFYGLSEVDWLARRVTSRWNFWQYLFGIGTRAVSDRERLLIGELGQVENRTVLEVCERREEDPDSLLTMALEHIDRWETGSTLAGQIRRGLYTELVRWAFGGPRAGIYEFLLDGYTRVESKTQPARETLVDELFRALIELCLLARMPIIFAFDALESLFGDPPEEKMRHPFFRGLADVLDTQRGIPFLIFAEGGHWQQVNRFLTNYAEQRLLQGVIRVPNHGTLSRVQFPPITAEQLGDIVSVRMQPLLAEYYESDKFDVPSIFPLTDDDLKHIARDPDNAPALRQALQYLRDRYDQLVNGKTESQPPLLEPVRRTEVKENLIEQMETRWQQDLRGPAADREQQSARSGG